MREASHNAALEWSRPREGNWRRPIATSPRAGACRVPDADASHAAGARGAAPRKSSGSIGLKTPTPTRSCSGRRRVAARARRMSGDEYWHRPSSWPRAAREARGAAAAGGPNTALAPANVRVAAVRDWSGAAASDEADGAHQRKSHARGLRARHGRRRRRARAATSPRWVDNAQQPVAGRAPDRQPRALRPRVGARLMPRRPVNSGSRARSSVDRALASGARGRKFESCRARFGKPC
jgi:hypothetical protein